MNRSRLGGLPAWLPRRYDHDLRLVLAVTALAVVLTVLPLPDPLRTPVLLPFVLVVPGYALTALLFPPGFVSRDERLILTIAMGIAVSALAGLVVQAIGLDRWTWLAMLVLATLTAAVAAQKRRAGLPAPPRRANRLALPLTAPVVVPLLLAVVLAAVAVSIASGGAEDQLERSRFTSVWLVPAGATTATPGAPLELGVVNHEGETARYSLRLVRDDTVLRTWSFDLSDEDEWSRTLTAPASQPGRPLVAALSRNGGLYRRVALEIGARR